MGTNFSEFVTWQVLILLLRLWEHIQVYLRITDKTNIIAGTYVAICPSKFAKISTHN